MKRIFTTITTFAILCSSAMAQSVLTGGFGTTGMGLINGTTYTKTGTLGSGGFPFVSASRDGSRFYAASQSSKLYYIDVATSTITDSIGISLRNLASSNEPDMLFSITTAAFVRVNTTTKAIDSVVLGSPWLPEERPNSKEVWVTDSGKIHVVDYSSSLNLSTFTVAPLSGDNAGVRFSPGGSMAFKSAGSSKMLFKIDPATKTVVTSINTFPARLGALVVSRDSSKLFAVDPTTMRIMIYKTSDLSLMDSIVSNKASMNIYRHPTRKEIWTVHHFDDSVSVYNEDTHALIAAFDISGSPWYLAFASGAPSTGIGYNSPAASTIKLFPNPATDKITVTGTNTGDIVKVYDVAGKVLTYSIDNAVSIINVSDLQPGFYSIQVSNKTGVVSATLPFIKR